MRQLFVVAALHFAVAAHAIFSLFFTSLILLATASNGWALSITATASGSLTPTTAPAGGEIINGDFHIIDISGTNNSPFTGDGWNEHTHWSFDFTEDPNFPSLSAGTVLQSAMLTLTLSVNGDQPNTDRFELGSLGVVSNAAFTSLARGTTATIDFELLNYYSSSSVVALILSSAGVVSAEYSDDALVSFAGLELVAIPEPTTALILAIGLTGIAVAGRRRRSH